MRFQPGLLAILLLHWPAAVLSNHCVDFGYQAVAFREGDHDFLVVGQVLGGEGGAFRSLSYFSQA